MADRYDIISYFSNEILDILFSYLSLSDFRNCTLVCRSWYQFLFRETLWGNHCQKLIPAGVLSSDFLSGIKSHRSKVRAFAHAWNPDDCSKHVFVKNDGFTLHRNPIAQSTDAIRGKIGFQYGRHSWEIKWDSPLGTVAVVGVATKDAPLQCNGYVPLVGSNENSWGWNLAENNLIHKGELCGSYPLLANAPKYEVRNRHHTRINLVMLQLISTLDIMYGEEGWGETNGYSSILKRESIEKQPLKTP